jgi:hypothetical protein
MYDTNFTEGNTSILGWLPHINDMVGGFFGLALLLVIMVGLFISFKKWETSVAMVATGFIGALIGAFFMWLEILNWQFLFIPVLLVVVSVFVHIFSNN